MINCAQSGRREKIRIEAFFLGPLSIGIWRMLPKRSTPKEKKQHTLQTTIINYVTEQRLFRRHKVRKLPSFIQPSNLCSCGAEEKIPETRNKWYFKPSVWITSPRSLSCLWNTFQPSINHLSAKIKQEPPLQCNSIEAINITAVSSNSITFKRN